MVALLPLVFSIHGGMGRESQPFYHRLADMIAEKKKLKLPTVTAWLRTKLCFSLLKSCLLCIRGSRTKHTDLCSKIESDDIINVDYMSKLN